MFYYFVRKRSFLKCFYFNIDNLVYELVIFRIGIIVLNVLIIREMMLLRWFISSSNCCCLFIRLVVIIISLSVLLYLKFFLYYLIVVFGWSKSDGKDFDFVVLVGLKDLSGK